MAEEYCGERLIPLKNIMENFGRRAEDKGQEAPIVTLARIDENIKFLKTGAEAVRIQLFEHEKEDKGKFEKIDAKVDGINKSIWIASGALAVIVFVINIIIKH